MLKFLHDLFTAIIVVLIIAGPAALLMINDIHA